MGEETGGKPGEWTPHETTRAVNWKVAACTLGMFALTWAGTYVIPAMKEWGEVWASLAAALVPAGRVLYLYLADNSKART